MLINHKGHIVNPNTLPKNPRQRESMLKGLREVLKPSQKYIDTIYKLKARAHFVERNNHAN